MCGSKVRSLTLLAAVGALLALAAPSASAHSPRFLVGAAKADITPTSLEGLYLGGYGIGPSHLAKGVLRAIYARAIAIRDRSGHQVVIVALDLQGHFLAYQQGAYGFADIASDIQRRLGIPASNLLLQSTHTHNGPDDLGVWGGVPDSYLARVKAQTEAAIVDAVRTERPADLVWGTADKLLPWPKASARYRKELPQADWVLLDGIGHCPQLDVPVEAAQLILGFTS